MQSCGVFLRNNSIYVVSQSFTASGIGISVGPMFKVDRNMVSEVGKAVLAALESSRQGIPQPTDLRPIQTELFRFTGARNWSDLAKTSTYTAVRRESSTINVEPHKIGAGASFVPDGPAIPCSSDNAEEIGRGVLHTFKLPEVG